MVSAREIRARVRSQMEQELRMREEAVVSVASAVEDFDKLELQLDAAARRAGSEVNSAVQKVSMTDLAALADVPVMKLRRLARRTGEEGESSAALEAAPTEPLDPDLGTPPMPTGT